VGAGECGFLYYNPLAPPDNPPVHISFHATHPDSFALFRFRIVRGPNLVGATYVNGYMVSALSAGVYTGDGLGNFENDFSRTTLLGPCIEAAFSENLYVFAKATTGWRHRINRFDASDVRAFALTPEKSGLSLPMELMSGWNMVSLPLAPVDSSLSSVFPGAELVYRYEEGIGYIRVLPGENMEVGMGYWILLNEPETYNTTGGFIEEYNLTVKNRWYMIGGCSLQAEASVYNGAIKTIYDYIPGVGYQEVPVSEELDPGKGYWILLKDIPNLTELTVSTHDF